MDVNTIIVNHAADQSKMAWAPQKESCDKAGLDVSWERSCCLSLDPRQNGKSEEFLVKPGKAEVVKQQKDGSVV